MRKSVCIIMVLWLGSWWADVVTGGSYILFPCAVSDATVSAAAEGKPPAHPVLKQGVLLIAGENLLDPIFARTVILLTEYGDEGVAGLVLNRRITTSAIQALPQLGEYGADPDTIHIGGPVAVNYIRLLVKGDNIPGVGRPIVDNIFMIDTVGALRQLESERVRTGDIRMFLGYAGWAPGQLETELLHGDWFIWPATSEIIFNKHPENVWHELIYLATAKWI